jgi:hypothetical protein
MCTDNPLCPCRYGFFAELGTAMIITDFVLLPPVNAWMFALASGLLFMGIHNFGLMPRPPAPFALGAIAYGLGRASDASSRTLAGLYIGGALVGVYVHRRNIANQKKSGAEDKTGPVGSGKPAALTRGGIGAPGDNLPGPLGWFDPGQLLFPSTFNFPV